MIYRFLTIYIQCMSLGTCNDSTSGCRRGPSYRGKITQVLVPSFDSPNHLAELQSDTSFALMASKAKSRWADTEEDAELDARLKQEKEEKRRKKADKARRIAADKQTALASSSSRGAESSRWARKVRIDDIIFLCSTIRRSEVPQDRWESVADVLRHQLGYRP